jgi:NAD(P)H dehydrogenase (quinone)
MAYAIARGARKEKLAIVVKEINGIRPVELLKYDAIVIGSPTYYGLMAAEVKKLIDASVRFHGRLAGKIGGAFTSSGGIAGGGETTILAILQAFLIHGMVVVGESGAYHYGPVAIGRPDKKILVACEIYGHKIAGLAKSICFSRE